MRLEPTLTTLRQRVFTRYARSLKESPSEVIDYLLGHVALVSRTLPSSQRFVVAERLRDAADLIERFEQCGR